MGVRVYIVRNSIPNPVTAVHSCRQQFVHRCGWFTVHYEAGQKCRYEQHVHQSAPVRLCARVGISQIGAVKKTEYETYFSVWMGSGLRVRVRLRATTKGKSICDC